ncbi:Fur family ferric uptake transcriptional regulator [Ruminiclostridium sufflavum DSM 19573]|uniref:Fur family ferric uptake transcriptional regulator n=1 Tax=Ruminiclostridium sufflavum DSM 19573 TaxID=1121337 RepID=A0A318XPG3_9FIRM|nr:transcriptional repressor [Ruminiclostridium sufflavum]PYG89048.1 Fur family ferric uptake transcriptional regulator [Ruminiclostridium sufflavum DSM 19573]
MRDTGSYSEILKREGLKNTKHRNAILKVIENSDQPIDAEQIFFELKKKDIAINLSSVYRILESLVSKNLLIKSNISGANKALYELNCLKHTHYLICSRCKKMFSVEGCPLEEYEKKLAAETEFEITGHKLEIYGLCKDCKQNNIAD